MRSPRDLCPDIFNGGPMMDSLLNSLPFLKERYNLTKLSVLHAFGNYYNLFLKHTQKLGPKLEVELL